MVNSQAIVTGSCVPRGIITSVIPPCVSSPTLSSAADGTCFIISSFVITAMITAPSAIVSSGLSSLQSVALGNVSLMSCCTRGIRVDPPTRITSLTSSFWNPAFCSVSRTMSIVCWNTPRFRFSKRKRGTE